MSCLLCASGKQAEFGSEILIHFRGLKNLDKPPVWLGLLPLCATTVIEPWQRERAPQATEILRERLRQMPELIDSIHPTGPGHLGYAERGIVALVNPDRLRRILTRMLDENEFLSPYGIRALSRFHADHPDVVQVEGQEYGGELYLPAESDTAMFGGNSNWRGHY